MCLSGIFGFLSPAMRTIEDQSNKIIKEKELEVVH
jgi:hypothetical protein